MMIVNQHGHHDDDSNDVVGCQNGGLLSGTLYIGGYITSGIQQGTIIMNIFTCLATCRNEQHPAPPPQFEKVMV